MKSVSFKTVGCRLNQAETTELTELFAKAGFTVKPFGTPTDAVVIHTCAVTARAEQDCLRIARSCAKRDRKPFIVLAGCAAEVNPDRLKSECSPDLVVGQSGKFDLPRRLAEIMDVQEDDVRDKTVQRSRRRAVVKIQTGCDFHCTYCIVPAARGTPVSLPQEQIVQQVMRLAGEGVKEIVLTGANLGCYGKSADDLVSLLKAVERVAGISRIRLSSIEMSTAEKPLVDFMVQSRSMCRYLHIPLQSGSDSVLSRMNRRYSSSDYRQFCEYALDKMPDLALGSDVIAGFPGETDDEFNATQRLVTEIPFANLHVFQYSARSGTPAAAMPGQVPPALKRARSDRLMELGAMKKVSFANGLLGTKLSVLVEEVTDSGTVCGWTPQYLMAEIQRKGPKLNDIVEFVPTSQQNGILIGR